MTEPNDESTPVDQPADGAAESTASTDPQSPPGAPMTRRQLLTRAGLATAGVAAVTAVVVPLAASPRTSAHDFDAAVPTAWFDLMRTLVRTTIGYSPPAASRAFGYAGVALYEAVVPGSSDHRSLHGVLTELPDLPAGPSGLHWPAVANTALATMLRLLFATTSDANKAAIDRLETTLAKTTEGRTPAVAAASKQRGQDIAQKIFQWSTTDGGHEAHLRNYPPGYVLPNGPGLWVPTPPGYSPAMQPTWGQNRCFALKSPAACPAGNPTPYSEQTSSAFHAAAMEVYQSVNTLTPEQAATAWFWSDEPAATATPPGHMISIATQVLRTRRASLMTAGETYAKVGIALADAFIACWHTKYQHNLQRPVSYINAHLDAHWLPLLDSPPFPEYTSGHSVQSAAALHVLADLHGDARAFTDHTHDSRGMAPRRFKTFSQAAEEAAISRLYGGIHYRPAIEQGLAQGRCIGQAVNRLPVRH